MSDAPKENDEVYRQRNEMAILLANMALRLGWDAGWARDDNEDWDDGWRTVVYVDLPEGQVCWHMDPERAELARGVLPKYEDE